MKRTQSVVCLMPAIETGGIIPIRFGDRWIGAGHKVVVIAEIGINHEGSAERCAAMIVEAARAGADAIKLQTVDPDESYQQGTPSHALFSAARMSREETATMFRTAREAGIEAFTTAGDLKSLEWVDRLEPAALKISSGLLTHIPLLRRAAKTGRTILVSTGMAALDDIDVAVAAARDAKASGLGLLQCTSIYPARPDELNLAVIGTLEQRYRVPVGFSDHSLGTSAAALAVAAGAHMIEKHFTFDVSRQSFDHGISLDREGLAVMVRAVREAETMLGDARKVPVERERETALRARRSLVAKHLIKSGHPIDRDDVAVLRTAPSQRGLSPAAFDGIIGRRVRGDIVAGAPITEDALEPER